MTSDKLKGLPVNIAIMSLTFPDTLSPEQKERERERDLWVGVSGNTFQGNVILNILIFFLIVLYNIC